jgi:tungstate transport system substrate-binding protein
VKLKPSSILFILVLLAGVIALASGCATSTTTPAATTPAVTTTTVAKTPTPTATTPPKPANPEIIMASTTSTRDSGLLDVLIPIFQQKTGYTMKPVFVGSGAAIAMGQQGNADVLFVHSPPDEVTLMDSGFGINRKLVMHNYYLIVGPKSDPAGIRGMTVATDAMKKIADAKITFYSRGDKSGTDTMEKGLWKKIGITVADNSTSNPSWYKEGGTGTGMLDLLRVASEKQAYTFTDYSTFIFNQKVLSLDILVQGDPALINIYHVIQVNPAKWPKVNADGARAFSDFMMSAETQAVIAKYGADKYGQALFIPDAGKTEASLGSY